MCTQVYYLNNTKGEQLDKTQHPHSRYYEVLFLLSLVEERRGCDGYDINQIILKCQNKTTLNKSK